MKKGHRVTVITPNDYPPNLHFLPGDEGVVNFEGNQEEVVELISPANLIFCLDFNTLSRLEGLANEIEKNPSPRVIIDHHQDPDQNFDFFFTNSESCSTAELVYEFIAHLGDESFVDQNIGQCLYLGIVTDSGTFRFPAVTGHTHRVAAKLIDEGLNHSAVHQQVYDTNTINRVKLKGFALSEKLVWQEDQKVAYIALTQKELDRFNYHPGDTEGLVNEGLSIKGSILAVLFLEIGDQVKISFRSKGAVRSDYLARDHFGGGGHKNAAGGRFNGSIDEAVRVFLKHMPDYLLK